MKKAFQPHWWLVGLTAAASLAGFILRHQQLQTELLEDGSLAPGSSLHTVLAVIAIITVAGLIGLLLPLEKKERIADHFTSSLLPNVLQIVSAVMLIAGNILLWTEGHQPVTALAMRSPAVSDALASFLPPLGILSAVCIAAFAVCRLTNRKPSPLLYMVASIYLVVRLIVCFQEWNIDPSIHDYCYQLLAVICCMLATFQLAGFSFDKGKRRMTLFWTLSSVVFCSISSADMLLRGSLDDALINFALLLTMAVSSAQLLFVRKVPE